MNKITKAIVSKDPNQHIKQIKVTKSLATELGFLNEEKVHLNCGKTCIELYLNIVNSNKNYILLSETTIDMFNLPNDSAYLRVSYSKLSKTIYIGPVICFFTEIYEKSKDPISTLSSFSKEFQRLCNKDGGIFYLSNFNNFDKQNIEGYYYENDTLVKKQFPLPDVVYNRIHMRNNEKKLNHVFKFLNQQSIPYFNDKYLDKWELHNFIYSFPHLRPFVPETLFLSTENDLRYMLTNYDIVFLKPTNGSQGRSIFKISNTEDGYFIDASNNKNANPQKISNIPQLFKKIKRKITNRPYIIQRGITLLDFENRSFDIRVLCHQTDELHWKVTNHVARVSHPEMIVSNIAKGGELQPLDVVLLTSFDLKKSKHIKKFIMELCIDICTSLNGVLSGIYAEFGIDIGIDEEGKPWIIEVNTKPSKNTTNENNSIRPSVYSIYHACNYFGFNKE
jgi:glutathione synthase/RimK-type ligase-like ATP-grasp enzyme